MKVLSLAFLCVSSFAGAHVTDSMSVRHLPEKTTFALRQDLNLIPNSTESRVVGTAQTRNLGCSLKYGAESYDRVLRKGLSLSLSELLANNFCPQGGRECQGWVTAVLTTPGGHEFQVYCRKDGDSHPVPEIKVGDVRKFFDLTLPGTVEIR